MLETSARLLRLLSLLQTRREWSGPELAARLGIDARTVRRDVEKLRSLGYPVHSTPGVAGGYQLGSGAHLPPLLLDDDEAVAVAVGLRTAAGGSVTGIEESSVRALAKLEQLLPARLRSRVNALQSVTVPLTPPASPVDADLLGSLAAACRDFDRLRFEYGNRAGQASSRTVEPHRLACTGRRWYLMAWDVDRSDWRTFRVDRIRHLLSTGPRFIPREPPEDAATYITRAISAEPYRYQAKVKLHARADAIAKQLGPASAMVTPIDDRTCRIETGADSLMWLAVIVASMGVDFEVEDPPELVDHVRTLAERLKQAVA